MNPLRILLVDKASPFREALARALAYGGHQVQVAEPEGPPNDFSPDFVVCGEGSAPVAGVEEAGQITVRRPVNMEELRRLLRGG